MNLYATAPVDLLEKNAAQNALTLSVCGVFSSSFYMKDHRGQLILLHDKTYGSLPFGLAIADSKTVMRVFALDVGMQVFWEGKLLRIPAVGIQMHLSGQRLSAVKEQRRPSETELRRAILRGQERLVASRRGTVAELVTAREGEPIQNCFAACAALPLADLKASLRRNNGGEMERALSRLLGLGPGLTPSLDDFLTGFVYALHFMQRNWGLSLPECGTLMETLCRMAPRRTSEISAAYVVAAAAGERISLLEDALAQPGFFARSYLDRVLQVGGSSGGDLVTGMVSALQYIMIRSDVIHQ